MTTAAVVLTEEDKAMALQVFEMWSLDPFNMSYIWSEIERDILINGKKPKQAMQHFKARMEAYNSVYGSKTDYYECWLDVLEFVQIYLRTLESYPNLDKIREQWEDRLDMELPDIMLSYAKLIKEYGQR